MFEDHGYKQLRNNDVDWWASSYPFLTSSNVVPPPENLKDEFDPIDPTDRRFYAMYQRIKADWFKLYPTWGRIINNIPSGNYKILMYKIPSNRTIIETAWTTNYTYKT